MKTKQLKNPQGSMSSKLEKITSNSILRRNNLGQIKGGKAEGSDAIIIIDKDIT